MRIQCPFCSEQDLSEFTYHGDANAVRPDPEAPDAAERFFDAVHLRDNTAGAHDELWYHGFGCRSWLKVRRDTRTHEILAVGFAQSDTIAPKSDL